MIAEIDREPSMGIKVICRVAAALCWLLAGAIIFRRDLGLVALFPDDEHAAELGPVALFMFLYGVIVLMGGAIAELRERITRLERLLQASAAQRDDTRQLRPDKLPDAK
jgi:hypothetical protein